MKMGVGGGQERVASLNGVLKEGLTEKVTFVQRLED